MNPQNKTIPAMLAIIGLMLAVNLVVGSTRTLAQDKIPEIAITPVSITVAPEDAQSPGSQQRWFVFRLWSDGTVDVNHVGTEDLLVPRVCDNGPFITERVECFAGWQQIQ